MFCKFKISFSYTEKVSCVVHLSGAIVRAIVKELAPKTSLELGTYCGYSAVLMASVLPKGSRFITLEPDASNAEVAKQLIKLAGADVSEKVL